MNRDSAVSKPSVGRDEFGKQAALQYPQLLSLARLILKNEADAEDAVQQALCRAFEFRHQLRSHSLQPWLRRITANEALDILRRKGRQPVMLAIDSDCDTLPANAVSVEMALVARETLARVFDIIRHMRQQHRTLLVRAARGETLSEMVQSVSASRSAAKVQLCRARRELRVRLTGR